MKISKKMLSVILALVLVLSSFSLITVMQINADENEGTVFMPFSQANFGWDKAGSPWYDNGSGTWVQDTGSVSKTFNDDGSVTMKASGIEKLSQLQFLFNKTADTASAFDEAMNGMRQLKFTVAATMKTMEGTAATAVVKFNYKDGQPGTWSGDNDFIVSDGETKEIVIDLTEGSAVPGTIEFQINAKDCQIDTDTIEVTITPIVVVPNTTGTTHAAEPQRLYAVDEITYTADPMPTLGTNDGYTMLQTSGAPTEDSFIEFTLPNVDAGDYTMYIYSRTYSSRTVWDVAVDGTTIGTADFRSNETNAYNKVSVGEFTVSETKDLAVRLTVNTLGASGYYINSILLVGGPEVVTTTTQSQTSTTAVTGAKEEITAPTTPVRLSGGWGSTFPNPSYKDGGKIAYATADVPASVSAQLYIDLSNFEELYNEAVKTGEEICFDICVDFEEGTGATFKADIKNSSDWALNDDSSLIHCYGGVQTVSFPLEKWVPEGKTAAEVTGIHVCFMSYSYGAYSGTVYVGAPYLASAQVEEPTESTSTSSSSSTSTSASETSTSSVSSTTSTTQTPDTTGTTGVVETPDVVTTTTDDVTATVVTTATTGDVATTAEPTAQNTTAAATTGEETNTDIDTGSDIDSGLNNGSDDYTSSPSTGAAAAPIVGVALAAAAAFVVLKAKKK